MNKEQTDSPKVELADDRRVARGWGRIIPLLFWIAGVGTVFVALWQLFTSVTEPVGPRLATLLAGLVYVTAAIGLTHNGKRMRIVAWSCISVSLAGPLIAGLINLEKPKDTVWSPWADFGAQVWFFSLLLPLIGLGWMWWSNPRRIVELAETPSIRR